MNPMTSYSNVTIVLRSLLVIFCLFSQSIFISPVQAGRSDSQTRNAPSSGVLGGCALFPANNIWNAPVNNLPLHPRSSQWINSIGRYTGFHMDFGSGTWDGGPIGIPYNVVGAGVPKRSVTFYYPDESDPGPYPIPSNPKIEHGGDHHILIVDNSTCKLYELFDASYSGGRWYAGSGAIWDLNSNALRPDTWTSADAAGLPILPGLVRYEEVLSGRIDHAIRFTASRTNGYIWPARHLTSNNPGTPYIPPLGARFRLKASFNVSTYPPAMQVLLNAMKTYGIILADNGSNWYVSGAPDPRWNNDMLHLLDDLTGNDFEAVDTSVLMVNYNSGATGFTISGNAGVAGATLGYTVNSTPQTAASLANGSYSLPVPYNWSGTVTPAHDCFTFTPASLSYSSVTTNKTAQNYTATFDPTSGCADVDVLVAGIPRGNYGLLPGASTRASFTGVNNGPVKIASANTVPLIGAERVIYRVNGVNTSFSEMMALPAGQLDPIYWLPWYNNVDLDTQLRLANVGASTATVQLFIGGVEKTSGCTPSSSPYTLAAGESLRLSCAGVNDGPVEIRSTQNVVASERVIYRVNGVQTSFSEMMALPDGQTDTTFWLPWYNNVDLDTQLRFANLGASPATVHVTIDGQELAGSPFTVPAGESARPSFEGVNNGPLKIESDFPLVASARVIYRVNSVNTSFSEMMAFPQGQLDTTYWLPWYNNVDLDTQLRLGNVNNAPATVSVTIGGQPIAGSPFIIPAGETGRQIFAGVNSGPVKVASDLPIVVSARVIYKVNNLNTSFSEMMALPDGQLDPIYWLPLYNNVDLDTQLRFGRP